MDSLIQPTSQEDLPTLDENKDYLSELVGEGKKYKDQAALAKAVAHGSATIDIYKRRMDEMRQDLLRYREDNTTKAKLEEIMTLITNARSNEQNPPVTPDTKPAITEDQISSLVSNKVQEIETNRKEQSNYDLVISKVKERFGDNFQSSLKQQIDQLGISDVEATLMAKKSPNVLLKALGLDQPQRTETFDAPPRSQQRNDNFAPTGSKIRSWDYYQKMKVSNPLLYYDRQTAIQMQKDAVDLGERFRDGDYYKRGLHEPNN